MKGNRVNIKFKDGNEFITFDDNASYQAGCPRCDYGAVYANKTHIVTTHYRIEVLFENDCGYGFTVDDAIRLLEADPKNMTEQEFIDFIKGEVMKYSTFKSLKERNNAA